MTLTIQTIPRRNGRPTVDHRYNNFLEMKKAKRCWKKYSPFDPFFYFIFQLLSSAKGNLLHLPCISRAVLLSFKEGTYPIDVPPYKINDIWVCLPTHERFITFWCYSWTGKFCHMDPIGMVKYLPCIGESTCRHVGYHFFMSWRCLETKIPKWW